MWRILFVSHLGLFPRPLLKHGQGLRPFFSWPCEIKRRATKERQMKMNKLLVVAALAAVVTGCTSIQVTREGDYNDAQSKMTDRSRNPYHIDWDVKHERVTSEGTSKCWFWFFAMTDGCRYAAPGFTLDSGVAAAKDSATFHAVEDAQSDALLGCMYRITTTSKWLGGHLQGDESGGKGLSG